MSGTICILQFVQSTACMSLRDPAGLQPGQHVRRGWLCRGLPSANANCTEVKPWTTSGSASCGVRCAIDGNTNVSVSSCKSRFESLKQNFLRTTGEWISLSLLEVHTLQLVNTKVWSRCHRVTNQIAQQSKVKRILEWMNCDTRNYQMTTKTNNVLTDLKNEVNLILKVSLHWSRHTTTDRLIVSAGGCIRAASSPRFTS